VLRGRDELVHDVAPRWIDHPDPVALVDEHAVDEHAERAVRREPRTRDQPRHERADRREPDET